eukprot:TRINITY_DN2834_c0_g1_i1.p2 TRINITY_DN2834_c0_g1~~TRINITY_DN2834_c0_g1_i1.p2  ORF type:complete len:230 (-),score=73.39 TRINITY_DN2834_c0_g1_i1:26-715(-)
MCIRDRVSTQSTWDYKMSNKQEGDARATEQREFPSRMIFPIKGIGKGNIPKIPSIPKDNPLPKNEPPQNFQTDHESQRKNTMGMAAPLCDDKTSGVGKIINQDIQNRADRMTKEVEDDVDLRSADLRKNKVQEEDTLKAAWFQDNQQKQEVLINSNEEDKKKCENSMETKNSNKCVPKKNCAKTINIKEDKKESAGVTLPRFEMEEVKKELVAKKKNIEPVTKLSLINI